MEKIKILIADDQPHVREELKTILNAQENISVIGEASNGNEAIQLSGALHPNILLIDISMPDLNGLEASKIILKQFPEINIIILSIHRSEEYIIESYKIGAKGYILKDAQPSELLQAILSISKGGRYFKPTISNILKSESIRRPLISNG